MALLSFEFLPLFSFLDQSVRVSEIQTLKAEFAPISRCKKKIKTGKFAVPKFQNQTPLSFY